MSMSLQQDEQSSGQHKGSTEQRSQVTSVTAEMSPPQGRDTLCAANQAEMENGQVRSLGSPALAVLEIGFSPLLLKKWSSC